MLKVIVVLVGVAAVAHAVKDKCGLPSHLWCSSRDIAKACNVVKQCARNDWCNDRAAAPPVSVAVYYESLCPFCQQFINDQLYPTFKKLGSTVMNVTLFPYGNTRETKQGNKWVFNCQHGPNECKGNLIESCAIKSKSFKAPLYLPFIDCMEKQASETVNWDTVLETCGPEFNVSVSSVKTCTESDAGNKLEHQMGVATKQAGSQYAPWIVINGKHSNQTQTEAQNDLLKLMCQTYTGPKPSACQTILYRLTQPSVCKPSRKTKYLKKHHSF